MLWGAGGALLIVGMRRLGRRWWIAGTAVVIAFGVAITYASPIVLDPLFNKFTPLRRAGCAPRCSTWRGAPAWT